MTEAPFPARTAFAFLIDVKTNFYDKFAPEQRNNVIGYGFNNTFSPILKEKMVI
jgi:hypothetical protein